MDTNWWAVLFDGAIPSVIAAVVTIQMALLAVRAERYSRMNERRLDMGYRFLEALQTANVTLDPDRRRALEQLTPALIHFTYLYGTYGRYRHFKKYMTWMENEIHQIVAMLNESPQQRLTARELEDLNDTYAVIISSTLDWMMMDDEPRKWSPSTAARTNRAAERSEHDTDAEG